MARPRKKKPEISEKLIKAARKVGFDDAQIAGFKDAEALKEAVYRLDPRQRLELEPPPPKPTYPRPPEPQLVDKVETFTVSIDARIIATANHAACEEMQIQSQLRGRRIRNIQQLSIVRPYIPDKRGQLVSQVTVNYKEAQ